MLGPLLILIYIYDIYECVVNKVLQFGDDKKSFGVAANEEDRTTTLNA